MKYQPLTRGKLRDGDHVLHANFTQDCEAKRRWWRVPKHRLGKSVPAMLKKFPKIKFRRPAR